MAALKVGQRNVADLRVQRRIQSLDDGGLPYSGLSGEKADVTFLRRTYRRLQLINALTCQSGCLDDRIASALIDAMKISELLRKFFSEYVNLVQGDGGRDAIDLAGHQKPVQKRELDLREKQGHDYESAVQIGCDHVRLSGKVGRAAYHVVLAVKHLDDRGRMRGGGFF